MTRKMLALSVAPHPGTSDATHKNRLPAQLTSASN
jgi:hypothetical protein